MSNPSTRLLAFMIAGLFLGNAASAQSGTGLSRHELWTIKIEISVTKQRIKQLRANGEPIPADMRSDILSHFVPYSPALTAMLLLIGITVVLWTTTAASWVVAIGAVRQRTANAEPQASHDS